MPQSTYYIDVCKTKISLKECIASGGEGVVYDTHEFHDVVVKLYHHPPDQKTVLKLIAMVKSKDPELRQFTTWPISTVSDSKGVVCGFIMRQLDQEYRAIHQLFSPGDRKEYFPQVDWHFLVHVARNLSAAFAVVHKNGYVIGDVNEGNIYIAKDGTVRLIDCDSFQVSSQTGMFLCEVGVPQFTSPELLKMSSFKNIIRTANHDNFGLAVLCFHLLFMGRHPFSGVPPENTEITLEEAIKQCIFAYSKNPGGLTAPPRTMPMHILPEPLQHFFEAAFSQNGCMQNGRPTAAQWKETLESLTSQIAKCHQNKLHAFYNGLSGCPWCYSERAFGTLFFADHTAQQTMSKDGAKVISEAYSFAINQVPQSITHGIDPDRCTIHSINPPMKLSPRTRQTIARTGVIAIALIITLISPEQWFIWLGGGSIIAGLIKQVKSESYLQREAEFEYAKERWSDLNNKWDDFCKNNQFEWAKNRIITLKSEYDSLQSRLQAKRAEIYRKLIEQQLDVFLSSFKIASAGLPHIRGRRLAMLAQGGINTAADISWVKLDQVKGFGAFLHQLLEDWRNNLEARFQPSPTVGQEVDKILNQKFDSKRTRLENETRSLFGNIRALKVQMESQKRQMLSDLQAAARVLAQAQADLGVKSSS